MEVLAWMARNGDAALFCGMLVVPMATFLANRIPAVPFYELDHVPDLRAPLYISGVDENFPKLRRPSMQPKSHFVATPRRGIDILEAGTQIH